jgi:hypothetical protein
VNGQLHDPFVYHLVMSPRCEGVWVLEHVVWGPGHLWVLEHIVWVLEHVWGLGHVMWVLEHVWGLGHVMWVLDHIGAVPKRKIGAPEGIQTPFCGRAACSV